MSRYSSIRSGPASALHDADAAGHDHVLLGLAPPHGGDQVALEQRRVAPRTGAGQRARRDTKSPVTAPDGTALTFGGTRLFHTAASCRVAAT
jgi:hypothetical protein